MATDKVLFVNDFVLISERDAEGETPAALFSIEVETKSGRQVLALTPDVAQALLAGLEHILKRGD
jgi:hypothetical protein